MNRNRKAAGITYTLAAGVLIGAASMSTAAAPLAGASNLTASAKVTESESQISIQGSGHIAVAGANLALSNIFEQAKHSAETNLSSSETTAVAENAETQAPAAEAQPVVRMGVAVCQGSVNVRNAPSTGGEVVGKLHSNNVGVIEGEENGWFLITSGNVHGYISGDYFKTDEALLQAAGRRTAKVGTETLYVRKEPSTTAKVRGMVPGGEDLTVIDESTPGWAKIQYEEGEGFVSTKYVTISTIYTYGETNAEEAARIKKEEEAKKAAEKAAAEKAAAARRNNSSSSRSSSSGSSSSSSTRSYNPPSGGNGAAVANFATQFVGNPYVWGGTSLTNGADCSGFVMSVYENFGVSLPHSSSADRGVGYGVSVDEMQAGDIVCYSGHVAIAIGDGMIVHAASSSEGIKISDAGYHNILAVRRIF